MPKMLFTTFFFLTLTVHASDRKTASDAKYNCSDVLKEKKIKSCTDLGPASQCKKNPSLILKKGDKWADEFQSQAAEEIWTTNPEHCVDFLTDVVEKKSCCGG